MKLLQKLDLEYKIFLKLVFEEVYKKFKDVEKAENEKDNSNGNKRPKVTLDQKKISKVNKKDKEKKGSFY